MADILSVAHVKDAAIKQNELYGLRAFTVGPIGTEYTRVHKGVASDSIRGQAADADAINFCLLYLPQRMVTYGTMNKFSRDDADFLARCWSHRAEHYFWIWAEASSCSIRFSFTEAQRNSYVTPASFEPRLAKISQCKPMEARVEQLRTLRPSLVGNMQKYHAYHNKGSSAVSKHRSTTL